MIILASVSADAKRMHRTVLWYNHDTNDVFAGFKGTRH